MDQNLSVDPPFSQTPQQLEASPFIHEEKIVEQTDETGIPFYKKPRFLIAGGVMLGVLGIMFIFLAISVSSKRSAQPEDSLAKDRTNIAHTSNSDKLEQDEANASASPTADPTSTAKPKPTATPRQTAKPTPAPTSTPRATATPTPAPTPIFDLKISQYQASVQGGYLGQGGSYPTTPEPPQEPGFDNTWYERPGSNPFAISVTATNAGPQTATQTSISRYVTVSNVESAKGGVTTPVSDIAPNNSSTVSFNLPKDPGIYEVDLIVYPNSSLLDSNTGNNTKKYKYLIRADATAPKLNIFTERDNQAQQTCVRFSAFDDVSTEYDMTAYGKMDGGEWQRIYQHPDPSKEETFKTCLSGPAGESHTYAIKVSDKRNNTAESSYSFNLYSF